MMQDRKIARKARKQTDEKRERGQGLVEFSITIVFMMILLVGVMDLGRAFFTYLSIMDAAQEGAAYASIAPGDLAGIRDRVRAASSGTVTFAAIEDSDIQVSSHASCAGHGITITIQNDFTFVAPFVGGRTIPLTATVTDTILSPPC
jgi:Flp pilus assembly protein TadG